MQNTILFLGIKYTAKNPQSIPEGMEWGFNDQVFLLGFL
jgi:hypothetical protein